MRGHGLGHFLHARLRSDGHRVARHQLADLDAVPQQVHGLAREYPEDTVPLFEAPALAMTQAIGRAASDPAIPSPDRPAAARHVATSPVIIAHGPRPAPHS